MASTYALPVNGSYYNHGTRHSHSSASSLRSDTLPSARVNAANGAAVKYNSLTSTLQTDPNTHRHQHSDHIHTTSPLGYSDHRHSYSAAPALQPFASMKTRPRGESDLGRSTGPANRNKGSQLESVSEDHNTNSTSWLSPQEVISAILIPLPFLLSSVLQTPTTDDATILAQTFQEAVAAGKPSLVRASASNSIVHTGLLTSGTLLLVGLAGVIQSSDSILDRRKSITDARTGSKKSSGFTHTLAQASSRAAAIGLLFYASAQLGGAGVALPLLTALTAGLNAASIDGKSSGMVKSWGNAAMQRKWSVVAILASLLLGYSGFLPNRGSSSVFKGHLALLLSFLVLPLPLPSLRTTPAGRPRVASNLVTPSTPSFPLSQRSSTDLSPLIRTADDVSTTVISGLALSIMTGFAGFFTPGAFSISLTTAASSILCIATAAGLVLLCSLPALQSQRKVGLAMGCLVICAFTYATDPTDWKTASSYGIVSSVSFAAVILDTSKPTNGNHQHHGHGHSHGHHGHDRLHGGHSRLTGYLLKQCVPGSILHSILLEKDSRRIAYFASLNLAFMMVQFFYGVASGSLGLLTDSIHMLFDCAGLAVGLAAAVMSKWPPSIKFPYGYGKVDTISGFANGIFLMLVSVEIVFDAIERLSEGHELRRLNELLIVSILGFLVNLVGLTAFGHAHHGHGHDHGHDHSHENENMQGIFLHIMADALGSVAVIMSTLATKYYGWSGWDAIASCVVAILIFVSAIPLVKSSGLRLLLSLPADNEYGIRNTLQEITSLQGVVGYSVPRFWLEDAGAAHADAHAHSHEHAHAHGHDHDHGHEHDHSHSHGEKCNHGHEHAHHDHSHESHSHDHHDHKHSHEHSHSHNYDNSHNHSHSHSHSHAHSHDHDDHSHSHNHSHSHSPTPQRLLGLIHIIAARPASLDDVRHRVAAFLKERNMDVVIHVERDGDTRCWCGGGSRANPLSPACT